MTRYPTRTITSRSIVGYNKGAAIHLSDVADVVDSVQNVRTAGYVNSKRGVTVIILRQPGANIIQTVDAIRAQLPYIKASIPEGIDMTIVLDRTTTIRASVKDVERTLILSIVLVIGVVFVFLRNAASHSDSRRRRARLADWDVRRDVSLRLFPGQSFADGFDDCHRLCGG